MKLVQILGPGCPRCATMAERAQAAIDALGIEAEVEEVTDINEIMDFGVMMTPALAVDDEVKLVGRVPTVDEIKELLASG